MLILLFSASYDASIRIWDTQHGVCLHSLTKHDEPVNSISWHPDGEYLVSGALDGYINIWNTKVCFLFDVYNVLCYIIIISFMILLFFIQFFQSFYAVVQYFRFFL